jgi:outer membrane protein
MKFTKIGMLTIIILIVLFGRVNIFAQNFKIGVVEVETVLKELPEAVDADKKIKDIGQKWQDTLLKMRQDLQAKFDVYQKQKAMMKQDQQQKEEETLQAHQMVLLQYQDEKFGQQNGEINKLREQLLSPIREKIKAAIEKVAKEEKFQLVVDKIMSLYNESSIDITYRVLDAIKRGGGK